MCRPFFCKVKMALETRQGFEFAGYIGCLGLDFLHANTIGLGLGKPGLQPFAGG